MNLEDILAEHDRIQTRTQAAIGDLPVSERCTNECPACAQKRLVEWLDTMCYDQKHNAFAVRRGDCLKCQQALRREVGEC